MNLNRFSIGLAFIVGCADGAADGETLQLQLADGDSPTHSGTSSMLDAGLGILPPRRPSADAGPTRPGEGCAYVSSLGTAVVEQIEAVGPEVSSCDHDPVRVTFRFEPDQGDAAAHGVTDARTGTFTLAGGKAPPRACITAADIQVGSRLRVQRDSLVRGTCSPTVFTFDEALVAACTSECISIR